MWSPLVALPVQRLQSMLRLTHVTVVRRSAAIPLNLRQPETMTHQLQPSWAVATLLMQSVVLAELAFLPVHFPYANLELMMSHPRLFPLNLVSSHCDRFIHIPIHLMGSFPQKRLPGQPTFMIILWTHILSHRRHPSLDKATAIVSQIGGIILRDPQYPGHQVRSEAHPALAPSSDVSHGARLRQAYTTTMKRAT